MGTEVAVYNPPYLYLLAAMTYLPIPKLVAVTLISVVFDVVLAGFAALVVPERSRRPSVGDGVRAGAYISPTWPPS